MSSFLELINKLERYSINKPWSIETKNIIRLAWTGKYDDLKNRVQDIEKEIVKTKDHLKIVK